MTIYQKQGISWLEYRASVTGKSVEELRADMSARSKLADKTHSGFASRSPEERKAISKKGVEARRGKDKTGQS